MDILVFRLELYGQGPFTSEFRYNALRQRIIELGPRRDACDTNFLNYYDNHSYSPILDKQLYEQLEADRQGPRRIRFGFESTQAMAKAFGVDTELEDQTFTEQFKRVLDDFEGLSVKVYLTKPIRLFHNEVIFLSDQAELVETANSFSEFLNL